MDTNSARRFRNALRTGPWLTLSLLLIPALGNATEPFLPAGRHAVNLRG